MPGVRYDRQFSVRYFSGNDLTIDSSFTKIYYWTEDDPIVPKELTSEDIKKLKMTDERVIIHFYPDAINTIDKKSVIKTTIIGEVDGETFLATGPGFRWRKW